MHVPKQDIQVKSLKMKSFAVGLSVELYYLFKLIF
jgi:hypothetical protein